jgi:hypothetical protein
MLSCLQTEASSYTCSNTEYVLELCCTVDRLARIASALPVHQGSSPQTPLGALTLFLIFLIVSVDFIFFQLCCTVVYISCNIRQLSFLFVND